MAITRKPYFLDASAQSVEGTRSIGMCAGVPTSSVRTLGGLEGAVAIAQQDAYRARALTTEHGVQRIQVRHNQIEMAIAVEVPHRHGGDGQGAGGVALRGLESAVAIIQQ